MREVGVAYLQSHVLEDIFGAPKEPHEVPSFPFCLAGVGYSDRGTNSSTIVRFFPAILLFILIWVAY